MSKLENILNSLHKYQLEFILDEGTKKEMEAARQVGKTYMLFADILYRIQEKGICSNILYLCTSPTHTCEDFINFARKFEIPVEKVEDESIIRVWNFFPDYMEDRFLPASIHFSSAIEDYDDDFGNYIVIDDFNYIVELPEDAINISAAYTPSLGNAHFKDLFSDYEPFSVDLFEAALERPDRALIIDSIPDKFRTMSSEAFYNEVLGRLLPSWCFKL